MLPPCTRGDYRGVGGEKLRCLHVFDESGLVATEGAFLSVGCRAGNGLTRLPTRCQSLAGSEAEVKWLEV